MRVYAEERSGSDGELQVRIHLAELGDAVQNPQTGCDLRIIGIIGKSGRVEPVRGAYR
jgi:hypothetical protein